MLWRSISVVLFCLGLLCLLQEPPTARAFIHGVSLVNPAPATPAQASAFGFNTLKFYDGFGTLGTTDVNLTHAHTFNWYTDNGQYVSGCSGMLPIPSWWSLVGSALNISTETSCQGGLAMSPFLYTGVNTYYNQLPTIPGSAGFYMEFWGQWNLGSGSSNGGPWMNDITALLNQIQGSGSGYSKGEIDVGEATTSGMTFNLHQWTAWNATNEVYHASVSPYNGADFTLFHKWGARVVPKALNGGTGEITFWFDGSALGTPCTYTASTASCGSATHAMGEAIEASTFVAMFNPGVSNKIQAKYYAIWTP